MYYLHEASFQSSSKLLNLLCDIQNQINIKGKSFFQTITKKENNIRNEPVKFIYPSILPLSYCKAELLITTKSQYSFHSNQKLIYD